MKALPTHPVAMLSRGLNTAFNRMVNMPPEYKATVIDNSKASVRTLSLVTLMQYLADKLRQKGWHEMADLTLIMTGGAVIAPFVDSVIKTVSAVGKHPHNAEDLPVQRQTG